MHSSTECWSNYIIFMSFYACAWNYSSKWVLQSAIVRTGLLFWDVQEGQWLKGAYVFPSRRLALPIGRVHALRLITEAINVFIISVRGCWNCKSSDAHHASKRAPSLLPAQKKCVMDLFWLYDIVSDVWNANFFVYDVQEYIYIYWFVSHEHVRLITSISLLSLLVYIRWTCYLFVGCAPYIWLSLLRQHKLWAKVCLCLYLQGLGRYPKQSRLWKA